jgi:predicted restriction endonuclease
MKDIVQKDLIKEYFIKNPNRNIEHPEIVDWVTEEYKKRTGNIFRDPDRAIRNLHQQGFLIKIKKGIYKYDPKTVKNIALEDFTEEQKEIIKKRDNYKCVICGKGLKDGVELHVDHIKPKDLGGKADIDNGQTLCSQHNFLKKNFKQTETGKKMFIRLYNLAKKENNKKLLKFCTQILSVYEKNNINGHIIWKR